MPRKSLPCPRCGKKDVIGTFCETCLRELSPLIEKVKEVTVTFCTESGDVKLANQWERLDPHEAIERAAERALVTAVGAHITEIRLGDEYELPEFLGKPGQNKKIIIPVTVMGRVSRELPVDYVEEYEIPITIKTTISPRFAKVGTQYFEGIIQTRNETPERRQALLKEAARRKGFSINKEEPHKGAKRGTDYYITSNKVGQVITQKLHERFGGISKSSPKLFTRDKNTGKDLYRVTYLLEYPNFEKGDILTDGKQAFRVVAFGRNIRYENLTTGKKFEEKYESGKYERLNVIKTTVSQLHPRTEVIDPDSFQQVPLANLHLPVLESGEAILVVKVEDKAWFVNSVRKKEVE